MRTLLYFIPITSMLSRQRNKLYLLLGVFSVYLLYRYSIQQIPNDFSPNVIYFTKTVQRSKFNQILLWNSYFEFPNWSIDNTALPTCQWDCFVTTDRSKIVESDVVLFHAYDLGAGALPTFRRPNQNWILFSLEPKTNIRVNLELFNNVFNLTMWYRKDSDIPIEYGHFQKRPAGSDRNEPLNIFRTKTKSVYWAVSNCDDNADRLSVANELRQYLHIDVYGKCGDLTCDFVDANCNHMFQQYKFVLAFENSLCQDYVSEKFWFSLQKHQIPIVYGAGNYSYISHHKSFIDVHDFHDLESVARFVENVSDNEDLYNSYFDWTKEYDVVIRRMEDDMCSVCRVLNTKERVSQVYSNVNNWVMNDLPSCAIITKSFNMWRWIFGSGPLPLGRY